MALQKTFNHPYEYNTTFDGYAWAAETNFNHATKNARFVFFIHKNEEAANAGLPPLITITYNITPHKREAEYGEAPLIKAAIPYQSPVYGPAPIIKEAVLDQDGNVVEPAVYGQAPIITPEVPAQPAEYGEAPIIKPALPSFDELIMSNLPAYQALAIAVYGLALTQPEFADAVVI